MSGPADAGGDAAGAHDVVGRAAPEVRQMDQILRFPALPQVTRRYRMTVLGPFTLHDDTGPVDISTWRPRVLILLRLLAVAPEQRRPRDEVIDLLWPEAGPEAGAANLRDLVRLARKAVGGPALVVLSQGWVALNPAYDWDVDLARFEELAREADDDTARLEEALSLMQGPPLPEDRYADWASPVRERVERRWRELCLHLSARLREQGDVEGALHWAQYALDYDPFDEAALRQVLRLLAALERRTEALRRYRQFADRLSQELGLPLSPETEAMIEQIRRGEQRSRAVVATASLENPPAPAPSPVPPESPPADVPPGPPIMLPAQLTSFIGRAREIGAVAALLHQDNVRLVTLTGPGGIGKTRLALRVGGELVDAFPDGLFFVPLASLLDPSAVAATVAAALGLKEAAGVPIEQTVALYLQSRRFLLILDNFEHLRSATPFIAQLVAQCPHLRLLVTSRAALLLSAEHRYEVPPLLAPAPDQLGDLATLERHEAVALFVARARAVRDSFALTPDNAAAVGAICRCLDGLPLAIELAAARTRLFPPPALLGRLSGRLELLSGGSGDRAARHQTLRATIDWSYALLSADEQRLFARLSVFAGGCTFDAVEAVCDPDGPLDLLQGMTSLIDNSLVRQEGEQDARFSLLETIRAYAAARLIDWGDTEAVGRRHAEFYLAMAQNIEPALTGPNQSEGLTRLEIELDNMRSALGWLWEHGRIDDELRLASALYWLWLVRGHCSEARYWLEEGLARGGGVAPGVRAGALWTLGGIAVEQGDNERATRILAEALALFRGLGDDGGSARTLNLLGVAAWRQGDYGRAITLYEEALQLATALDDRRERAFALINLGVVATHQGDFPLARQRLEEALALHRTRGDHHGAMHALINLGYDATLRGDLSEAEALFQEVLASARGFGMKRHIAYALENLGNIATLQGDHARAIAWLHEGLLLGQELGDQHLILYLISDLAKLEVSRGRTAPAARLGGIVVGLQQRLGLSMSPAEDQDRDRYLSRARVELGEDAFGRAWEDGYALGLAEAVAYALDEIAV